MRKKLRKALGKVNSLIRKILRISA